MNKKYMKKLIAVLMALAMVMSLFVVSLASAEETTTAAPAQAAAQETPAADESTTTTTANAEEETTTQKAEELTTAPAAEVPAATATAVDASNYPEDIFWVKKFKDGNWYLVEDKNSTTKVKETGVFRNENVMTILV